LFEPNVGRILAKLNPSDLVLDVGGWACPFNRAQWILDAQPFETRGFYRTFGGAPYQGPAEEWFTAATWIQRDICDHTPWPFANKQFDFAICSHTLEDVRDPLWVCSELIRTAKRGYIEVPSRAAESCLGVERPGQAGLSHHRWLIDITCDKLQFLQKFHMINADWRFALPSRFRRFLTSETSVQWLWWENEFEFEEVSIHGLAAQEAELIRFAQMTFPRPGWLFALDRVWRQIASLPRRAGGWLRRKACEFVV